MEDSKDFTIFRQARDAAKKRLEKVEEECFQREQEKLSLQATVASLDELLEDGERAYSSAFAMALDAISTQAANNMAEVAAAFDPLHGLTEAVRQILNIVPNVGMQAAEIARLMEQRGFDFSKYPNPVQPVHTVLTRLCTKGEAKIVGRTPGGRPLYAPTKRNTPPLRPFAPLEKPIFPTEKGLDPPLTEEQRSEQAKKK